MDISATIPAPASEQQARATDQQRRFSAQRRLSAAERALARARTARTQIDLRDALIDAAGLAGDLNLPSAQEAARTIDLLVWDGLPARGERVPEALDRVEGLLAKARDQARPQHERLIHSARMIRAAIRLHPDPFSRDYSFLDDYNILGELIEPGPATHRARAAMLISAEDHLKGCEALGVQKALKLLREGEVLKALIALEAVALDLDSADAIYGKRNARPGEGSGLKGGDGEEE